jgi:hypothetical protein
VLDHYRQAVDGFANHKYESANGGCVFLTSTNIS